MLAYLRSQQAQLERNKQSMLDRQRLQDKMRKEEEELRRGAIKKEKEVRKRIREEQLRQEKEAAEEKHSDHSSEEGEELVRHGYLGQLYSLGAACTGMLMWCVVTTDGNWGTEKTSCCFNIGSVCSTLLLVSVVVIVLVVIGIVTCNSFLDPSKCQAIKMGVLRYVARVLELLGAKM